MSLRLGRQLVSATTTALLIASAMVLTPAASAEAPSLQVVAEQAGDGTVGLRVRMPPGVAVTADPPPSVQVTVGDQPVSARVTDVQGDVRGDRVLLLVDASGSMQGASLRQVRATARRLLRSLDPVIPVGLATFSDDVRLVVPPTTDRPRIDAAITSIRAGGNTELFSALEDVIRRDLVDRIIVFTDGEDTTSPVDADDVVRDLSVDPVPIDVIAISAFGDPDESLARIVQVSGGSSYPSAQQAANGIRASVMSTTAVLEVDTDAPWNPDLGGRPITVSITDAGGTTLVGSTSVSMGTGQAPTQAQTQVTDDRWDDRWADTWRAPVLLAVLAFTAVAVIAISGSWVLRAHRDRVRLGRVMGHYSSAAAFSPDRDPRTERTGPTAMTLRVVPRRWMDRVRLQVEGAALPIGPVAWILVHATAMAVTFGLALILGLPVVIGIVAAILIGVVLQATVRARIESIRRQFDSELADFFTLVASSLRSGLSLAQAVSGAAASGSDVLARQMRRVTAEVALGGDLADALDGVAARMSSEDLALAVHAIRIQRESGGSLSNILDIAATTVRQRAQLQREVRALSAEGRISAIILMVLPLGIFAFFLVVRPEYVAVFWTEPVGWLMLGALVVILGVGALWMQRITRIDI